jgi:hypothetical protein
LEDEKVPQSIVAVIFAVMQEKAATHGKEQHVAAQKCRKSEPSLLKISC